MGSILSSFPGALLSLGLTTPEWDQGAGERDGVGWSAGVEGRPEPGSLFQQSGSPAGAAAPCKAATASLGSGGLELLSKLSWVEQRGKAGGWGRTQPRFTGRTQHFLSHRLYIRQRL